MTPAVLADLVRSIADDVLTRRGLDPAALPTTVTVQRPRERHRGDYATNVALQSARKAGVDPHEFAGWLAEALATSPAVHSAEVAGPGFLNLRLAADTRAEIIRQVLAAPSSAHVPEPNTRAVGASLGSLGVEFGASEVGEGEFAGPLCQVQYAHARLASLGRNSADLGITSEGARLELLEHEGEGELILALGDFPRIAALGEPRRLLRYLEELAQYRHNFFDVCRMLPMGDEEPGPLHAARLALCEATMRVLADGLRLLGTSAPERM